MNNFFPLYVDFRRGVDPRAIWTRASGGTLRQASGLWRELPAATPLVHHDSDGTPLGVLMGRGATNLIPNPRTPGGTGWVNNGLASVTDIVGPDGSTTTLSGRRFTEDTATSVHGSFITGVILPLGNYGMPVFVRAGTARYLQIVPSANGFGLRAVNFDALLGTITATTAALLSAIITQEANGWWRIAPFWPNGGSTNSGMVLYIIAGPTQGRAATHLGTGLTLDVAWPMIAAEEFSPVILPATTGASTRAQDSAVLLLRDWAMPALSAGAMTLAFRAGRGVPTVDFPIARLSDGTADNCVVITRLVNRTIRAEVFLAGASQGSVVSVGTVADNADAVVSVKFNSTELVMSLGGAAVVTAVPAGMPSTLSQVDLLGHGGTVARVGVRPQAGGALTNATLQSLSRQGAIA